MSTIRLALALVTAGGAVGTPAANAAPAPLLATPHTTITSQSSAYGQAAGDINGDGRGDLLVAGPDCLQYVVFGSTAPATVRLEALGDRGFTIRTSREPCLTAWVPLGDTNGDGRADVGAALADGTVRVVYGKTSTAPVDGDALGTGGLELTKLGATVEVRVDGLFRAGDINGDGRADIGLSGAARQRGTAASRDAAGIVFAPATGGRLAAADAPGILVYDPARPALGEFARSDAKVAAFGDANRDGLRDALVFWPGAGWRVVPGRATSAVIAPGPASVNVPAWSAPIGDVSGDGLEDLSLGTGSEGTILLSALAPPHFENGPLARRMAMQASLAFDVQPIRAGDLTGDQRDDAAGVAGFGTTTTSRHLTAPYGARVAYLNPRASGTVDLRTAGQRIDGAITGYFGAIDGAGRFTGGPRSDVLTNVRNQRVTVHTVAPKPTDRTPPTLSGVKFDRATIERGCTDCANTATLDYALQEPAWVESTLKRGTTVVGTAKGTLPAKASGETDLAAFRVVASFVEGGGCGYFGCSPEVTRRLPAGTYTLSIQATDLAGNKGTVQTATVTIV